MAGLEEAKIGNGKIIKGDCLSVMDELPNNHFILGFTSPPYLNAINYDEHVEKLQGKKNTMGT
jgi:DNA modification methylase